LQDSAAGEGGLEVPGFIPKPVEDLFLRALKEVPRPLGHDVIARTLGTIETTPTLLSEYNQVCSEYSQWTTNKFGGMAVRNYLGWDKEAGHRKSAKAFTTLAKTYSRLIPQGEGEDTPPLPPDDPIERDLTDLPEIRDWVTGPQAAEMLGISRSAVHKKMMDGEFKTLHRLGDRPHLVVLRTEVEQMRAGRRQ
jgi:predicted DNA-binding transcriptional regulator AlpA